ncbi:hypothetical protein GOP47_0014973 [Adiantum capillus-veneris]|uniref:BSD2 cysteine rich domain-containing protein n=1 Tax=Adiantum capillus-veneris TaxID=13818 RepID=A0A9D4ZER6_ADICA|nr:hypothetical protein GOP47_0014973 [Adiantum capillus-veneris]
MCDRDYPDSGCRRFISRFFCYSAQLCNGGCRLLPPLWLVFHLDSPRTTHHSYFGRSSAVEPLRAVEVRATEPDTQEPPPACSVNSILCKQCQGNGAIVCSQCKGDGINKEDFFSGHFKAGSICWLCRGKREMLCGDCNGAGFIGGFMSTFDD